MDVRNYKDIMSSNPRIDKDYLHSILGLSRNQTINHVEKLEIKESNTALVIRINVKINTSENIESRRLFIKTIKQDRSNNGYLQNSLKEVKFYKFIKDNSINSLPIPACYDAFISEETGEFVIVLEDLTDQYVGHNISCLHDEKIWFKCADTLARFHSVFWNSKMIDAIGDIKEIDSKSEKEKLNNFLNHFDKLFDDKIKTTFNGAMDINIFIMKEESIRIKDKRNITICNGDSHIFNFMLPINENHNPLMIDFQFWGTGIGPGDLAHLTRVNFSNKLKEDIQISLVRHYHKKLMEYGITNYSWDNCFNDYRACAATMVLIPFYQYSYHNVKYDKWKDNLEELIFNYDYLKSDEIRK